MSKCNKVKRPCKICLGPVTQKTGLQCHGACATWVHFSCLNYTPGKIKDIKAGIIKVTCPCPDCKTSGPKEFRTDQPYSCNNTQCPANRPPKCDNMHCPTNEGSSINPALPYSPPCPLSKCGSECKPHSVPQLPHFPRPPVAQPCVPIPSPKYRATPKASDSCFSKNTCMSGCSSISTPDIPTDYRNSPHGRYSQQQAYGATVEPCGPDSKLVEQLCNTVGDLTNQINDLMYKMKKVVKDGGAGGFAGSEGHDSFGKGGKSSGGYKGPPCTQPGPKHLCPKPCFCPGNPERRDQY